MKAQLVVVEFIGFKIMYFTHLYKNSSIFFPNVVINDFFIGLFSLICFKYRRFN